MALLLLKITIIFLFSYPILIDLGVMPIASRFLFEILAIVMMLVVVLTFAINKNVFLKIKYFILFLISMMIVLIGVILQNVSASSVIFGLRHYLLFLPFFLFPIVYDIKENDLKNILKLILICLLFQLPITILQRFVFFSHMTTGDVISGTIKHSGALSVLLIFAIAVLYSCYLNKIISYKKFIIITFCLFIPTTINETKVTFLFIPFVFILPTLFLKEKNIKFKLKKVFTYLAFSAFMLVVFIFIYDKIYGEKTAFLLDHLQRETSGRGYLYHGNKKSVDEEQVGRIDAVLHAYRYLSREQGKLFFGIGLGNIKPKKIKFLESEDLGIEKYVPYSTSFSNIFWEFGFVGLILLFTFNLFLFYDALTLKNRKDLIGSLGLGWTCMGLLMIPTYIYINTFYIDVFNVMFCLCAGFIVSCSSKLNQSNKLMVSDHRVGKIRLGSRRDQAEFR